MKFTKKLGMLAFRTCCALSLAFAFTGFVQAATTPASGLGDGHTKWVLITGAHLSDSSYTFTSSVAAPWAATSSNEGIVKVTSSGDASTTFKPTFEWGWSQVGACTCTVGNGTDSYTVHVYAMGASEVEGGGPESATYSVEVGKTISFRTRYVNSPVRWTFANAQGVNSGVQTFNDGVISARIEPDADNLLATVSVTGLKSGTSTFRDYWFLNANFQSAWDTYTITVREQGEPDPVEYYQTFKAAFTGFADSTFKLAWDLNCPGEELTQGPANFKIDLNGHKITVGGTVASQAPFIIGEGKTLTIADSSGSTSGKIEYIGTGTYMKFIDNHGTLNIGLNDGETIDAANREWNRAVMQREGATLNVTGGTLKGYFGIFVQRASAVSVQNALIGDLQGGTVAPIYLNSGASTVAVVNTAVRSLNPLVVSATDDASDVTFTDCEFTGAGAGTYMFNLADAGTEVKIVRGTVTDNAYDQESGYIAALANAPAKLEIGAGTTFTLKSEDVVSTESLAAGVALKKTGANTWVSVAAIPVTITALDGEKIVGEDDPEFSVKIEGEIGDADKAKLAYTVKREEGEAVGKYKIVISGESFQLDQYALTFVAGTFEIKEDPHPAYYQKFRESFTGSGMEFKLEMDLLCPGEELEQGSSEFTIDLNGFNIIVGGNEQNQAPFIVGANETLTIKDSSGSTSGKIEYIGTGVYTKFIDNSGTLNIGLNDGETIDAANREWNRAVMQRPGATLNVTGGTLKGYFGIFVQGTSTVRVSDSTVGAEDGYASIMLQAGASDVEFDNVTLKSASTNPAIRTGDVEHDKVDASTVVLKDCTITSGSADGVFAFDNGSTTKISIRGGTVSVPDAEVLANVPEQVTVYEGVLFNVAKKDAIKELAKGVMIKTNAEPNSWSTVRFIDENVSATLEFGQKLKDAVIDPAPQVSGTFAWAEPEREFPLPGTYDDCEATFTPDDDSCDPVTLIIPVAVKGAVVEVPVAVTGLVYNGNEQTGVVANVGYTLAGNFATDADDYTATATLADGYVWPDGSTDPTNVNWTIAAKAVTVTAVDKEKDYGAPDPTLTVRVDGEIGDEKVTYNDPTRAVGEKVGTYDITVTGDSEQGNYKVTFEDGTFTIKGAWCTDSSIVGPNAPASDDGIDSGKLAVASIIDLSTWAKSFGVQYAAVAASPDAYLDAFLLNCDPDDVGEEISFYSIVSIVQRDDGSWEVTPKSKNSKDEAYYGVSVIQGSDSIVDPDWDDDDADGPFYRAELRVKSVVK